MGTNNTSESVQTRHGSTVTIWTENTRLPATQRDKLVEGLEIAATACREAALAMLKPWWRAHPRSLWGKAQLGALAHHFKLVPEPDFEETSALARKFAEINKHLLADIDLSDSYSRTVKHNAKRLKAMQSYQEAAQESMRQATLAAAQALRAATLEQMQGQSAAAHQHKLLADKQMAMAGLLARGVTDPSALGGYVRKKSAEKQAATRAGTRPGDRYGSIHLNFTDLATENAWHVAHVIVHEASHKYLDTEDHAYGHELDKYRDLKREKAMNNADSVAFAVMSLYSKNTVFKHLGEYSKRNATTAGGA